METQIVSSTGTAIYSTSFDGHSERLQAIYAGLDDGAATTDDLRDVIQVLLGICADLSRQTLARSGVALGHG